MVVYGGIPYTMVPQIEQKNPFSGLLQRCGRVTLWGVLLLLLAVAGRSQTLLPGTPYYYTLTSVVNNSVADGSTNDVLQVTVYTQSVTLPYTYTPVNNVQVNFLDSGATTSTTINTGDGEYNSIPFAAGTIVFGQASITTTPADVEITIDGVQVTSEIFTYIPGPVNANPPPGSKNPSFYTTIIGSTDASSNPNGPDTDVVQVHATDGTNNEPPGTPTRFTILPGGTAGSTALLNGNSVGVGVPYVVPSTIGLGQNGSYDLPITDPVVGTVIVEAEVQNTVTGVWYEIGTPQTVTFVVAPVNPNPPPTSTNPSYYITTIPTADAGTDTTVVQLHATDGTNNEPPGTPIRFTILPGGTAGSTALLNGNSVAVNTPYVVPSAIGLGQNGSYDLPITDPVAGTVIVEAEVQNTVTGVWYEIGTPQTVTFVVAPVNPNPPSTSTNPSYYITTIPTADVGSDTAVVQLHATDGTNNEPPGTPIRFTILPGGTASGTALLNGNSVAVNMPYVVPSAIGLGQNGSYDLPITNTAPGTVIVEAEVQNTVTGVWYEIGTPQTVTFVIPPPTNNPPTGSTNPPYYITIIPSATADGSDTTVVQLHITDGTYNEPDGYKVQFVVTSNNLASTNAIMAGTPPTLPSTGTLTTVLAMNANGSIDIPITDLTAGSVTIQAYAWDPVTSAYDISFGKQTVTFTAGVAVPGNPGGGGAGGTSPGGGGLPPGGGGSGTGGTGPGGDNTGPGSNSGYTVLFVRQDNQLSNGQQQDSVIAYITDANTNAVVGVPVTFSIEITPNAGTISSGAQFVGNTTVSTDDSGMARIAMTSTTPGTVYVVATMVDPTSGNTVLIDGSYQIVTFVDKPDTSNPQTALTVIVYEALTDGVSRTAVEAHVVGMNGQVMSDQPVTFSIDSGTAQIVTAQPVYTDGNGNAIIYLTSTTPGYALVTATVDGLPIDYGSPARVYFAPINIYVPRVFTPNGDGVNDVLKPILVGIASFQYFTVYNRWGNIVYQTTDPNQGWDGTMKGVPQPVETYLWIAAGIDTNGKTIVQKGMTSLVR